MKSGGFDNLTPHLLIDGVESFTGSRFTGFANPLPSYINRVYEIEREDGEKMIVKYYRPGRWSLDAIYDEHDFILDCADDEIPVVTPVELNNGSTLAQWDRYAFALFPKKAGPMLEINSDEEWIRTGELIGRIHVAGSRYDSEYRMVLDPLNSTQLFIDNLLSEGHITESCRKPFESVCRNIVKTIAPLFSDFEMIRIHGDCHRGNIIHRPGEGLMIIDFDDMGTSVPVQDLWMLLPGRFDHSRRELNLLLEGYETFREFDRRSLKLIEPLRAMRIIYYIEWCSRQVGEHHFERNNPDWGSEIFWRNEINDLEVQYREILDVLGGNGS